MHGVLQVVRTDPAPRVLYSRERLSSWLSSGKSLDRRLDLVR